MSSDTADDPTTIGSESGRVALQRRREARTDHVHEIPFGERAEVTCPDCGETITVGIYGSTERSYDSCWTWDCDAYHKFERDRDAETTTEESPEMVQTTLVTDGGQLDEKIGQSARDGYRLDLLLGFGKEGRRPLLCRSNSRTARKVIINTGPATSDENGICSGLISPLHWEICIKNEGWGEGVLNQSVDMDTDRTEADNVA